ncbi:MAG: hypothetical protein D8M58_22185 [Calditrichaeota bacterium]|nr:MAG: hypothetical protein DWQ03_08575 [Calditrichota bacterium]MBL1208123.1 hypothetical protein [Calditrichota bacterium]NOG47962.1 outer membrane beta-barrel protein [Calditrichota bacterium]
MTKIFTLLIITSSLSFPQNADFRIGLFTGLNFSDISGDFHSDTSIKTGLLLGIQARVNLNNSIFFTPHLSYSMKGSTNNGYIWTDDAGYSKSYKTIESYDYLTLDILFSNDILKMENIVVDLSGGVSTSYLLNAEWDLDLPAGREKLDLINSSNRYDFGIVLDSKLHFTLFNKNVFSGIRYESGLTKIPEISINFKNRGFSIYSGLLL